MVFKGLQLD